MEELSQIYRGLYLDKNHLARVMSNADQLKRDMWRRNEKMMRKVKRSSNSRMKMKTEVEVEISNGRSALRNIQNQCEDSVHIRKAPVMSLNCWSRKKKRVIRSKKSKIHNENLMSFH